ncbi:hypothetical protein C0583_05595 [Candidatus Parcubacteria bacterium]|nr:MAG: hypothetical protein C0583_05595 [Candidatus Parcubacteria bacterium]
MSGEIVAIFFGVAFFICGWAMLYGLFYKGAFLDNNWGPIGGGIMTVISLGMICLPCIGAWDLYKSGLFGSFLKNGFVGFVVVVAVIIFIWLVLRTIHKFVKKFEHSKN